MDTGIETVEQGLTAAAAEAGGNVGGDSGAQAANGSAPVDQAGQIEGGATAGPAGPTGQDEGAQVAGDNVTADAASQPITDWSKVDLGLPEGVKPDPRLMESLGKVMLAEGLTEKQARALAAWNMAAVEEGRSSLHDAGIAALREAWGDRANQNQQAVRGVVSRIDRALEVGGSKPGAFTAALAESGADLRADIMRGLYEVSRWLGEDSLGHTQGMGGDDRPETALEGLQAAFDEARRGKQSRF